METISEMLRIGKAVLAASRLAGSSVVQQNADTLDLAADCLRRQGEAILFGVKNTGQIQRGLLRRLTASGRHVWHTIDAMADGGRAIDINILNPLTGRPMTGSSGATAVHVLLGINDAGIGTDGGGSVLAPALSLNLCSVMAKGIGLAGSGLRQSTEGISFFPGIGVISHSLKLAIEAILIVAELETSVLQAVSLDGLKLAVPASGAITLPDGSDMCDRLGPALRLARECGLQIVEIDLPDCKNRAEAIARLENIFSEHELIMTFEGPVDFYGLGDSVFGGWGPNATKSQSISGKYMVKIANMVNSTAVTIPAGDAACGLVVLARQGRKSGLAAMALGEKLSAAFPPPKLFDNYFRRGWERQKNDLLFSLEEYK